MERPARDRIENVSSDPMTEEKLPRMRSPNFTTDRYLSGVSSYLGHIRSSPPFGLPFEMKLTYFFCMSLAILGITNAGGSSVG